VQLNSGDTYSLAVMLGDGTVQEIGVSNTLPSLASTIELATALPSAPPPESNWILVSATVTPATYRVINRTLVQGTAGDVEMMHEITAIEYNPEKFSLIESNSFAFAPLPAQQGPPPVVSPVSGISFVVGFTGTTTSFNLYANWNFPQLNGAQDPYIAAYSIQLQQGQYGTWGPAQTVYTPSAFLGLVPAGEYYVRVAAVDVSGNSSIWIISNPITLPFINWDAAFNSKYASAFALEF